MTSRTEERRAASSGPRGTSKGTCLSARVRLARTMRWAIVASGVRKARAISSVVRPPRRRRVSAARDSVERTGWHAMKTRRRRSSLMMLSRVESRSGEVCSRASSSWASSSYLRLATALRRKRSMARRLAVAVSQAAGVSGTPECGDECLLRKVFGEADVTREARESGDDLRGLDVPDGFDGAVQGLMWIGTGHWYRSHQLSFHGASPAICWRFDVTAQRGALLCVGSALRTKRARSLPSQRPG